MAVNLASKYSSKVDERFKAGSFTEVAVNNEYDWQGVNAVNVYSIPTVAMGDYTRTGLSRYGTATELQNTVQTMTVTRDRAFTFTIDRGNHQETQMVMESGKALARQVDEVIVPEIDKYRLAVMAAAAAANGKASAATAITKSNAYEVFLAGTESLDEEKVPQGGRFSFVTPGYYNLLKLDNNFVMATDEGQKMKIKGLVGEVDNVKIIKIPSIYLPANTPFLIGHPVATVSPKKLEDYKTHNNPPGINGWLVEGRTIYDAFVLSNKVDALYVHKSA